MMSNILFVFLIGLIFGSFASMLSYRIPRNEDIITSRSRCTKCNHTLGILCLIPLLSYFIQNGKCKYCHSKISIRYPIIEIICALIFVFIYLNFGYSHKILLIYLTFFTLLVASLIDLKTYEVPIKLQILLLITALTYGILNNQDIYSLLIHPLYMYFAGICLKYTYYFLRNKDGLGLADINLFFIVTIFIGLNNFAYFTLLSGILGVVFGLAWQRIFQKNIFPFFPALSIAFLICYGIL